MSCEFCQDTGIHACPDVAEYVEVACSKKGCVYGAARVAYQKLCPYAPPMLPHEKSSTQTAYIQGYRSRDEEVEKLNIEIQKLCAEVYDLQTKFLRGNGPNTIADAVRKLMLVCFYRHLNGPSKILMPQVMIDIFNEENEEEHKNGSSKLMIAADGLDLTSTEITPEKNKVTFMGKTVVLEPDGER